jgi:hypothetical protein
VQFLKRKLKKVFLLKKHLWGGILKGRHFEGLHHTEKIHRTVLRDVINQSP